MKIFYTGLQRCGTKSFGKFFEMNGYKVFSWQQTYEHDVVRLFFDGRWLEILEIINTNGYQIFEDTPFSDPMLAIFIYHNVTDSRFVYFSRPADDWYKSMLVHSNGLNLFPEPLINHCYNYDLLNELDFLSENGVKRIKRLSLVGMRGHYVKMYQLHKHRIKTKFRNAERSRFYSDNLYDKNKFKNMAQTFGLKLKYTADVHEHKSKATLHQVINFHKYLR